MSDKLNRPSSFIQLLMTIPRFLCIPCLPFIRCKSGRENIEKRSEFGKRIDISLEMRIYKRDRKTSGEARIVRGVDVDGKLKSPR
jgi:hypothetical protein